MEAAAEHLLDEERDECDALSSSELQKLKLFERQVFYTQFQTRMERMFSCAWRPDANYRQLPPTTTEVWRHWISFVQDFVLVIRTETITEDAKRVTKQLEIKHFDDKIDAEWSADFEAIKSDGAKRVENDRTSDDNHVITAKRKDVHQGEMQGHLLRYTEEMVSTESKGAITATVTSRTYEVMLSVQDCLQQYTTRYVAYCLCLAEMHAQMLSAREAVEACIMALKCLVTRQHNCFTDDRAPEADVSDQLEYVWSRLRNYNRDSRMSGSGKDAFLQNLQAKFAKGTFVKESREWFEELQASHGEDQQQNRALQDDEIRGNEIKELETVAKERLVKAREVLSTVQHDVEAPESELMKEGTLVTFSRFLKNSREQENKYQNVGYAFSIHLLYAIMAFMISWTWETSHCSPNHKPTYVMVSYIDVSDGVQVTNGYPLYPYDIKAIKTAKTDTIFGGIYGPSTNAGLYLFDGKDSEDYYMEHFGIPVPRPGCSSACTSEFVCYKPTCEKLDEAMEKMYVSVEDAEVGAVCRCYGRPKDEISSLNGTITPPPPASPNATNATDDSALFEVNSGAPIWDNCGVQGSLLMIVRDYWSDIYFGVAILEMILFGLSMLFVDWPSPPRTSFESEEFMQQRTDEIRKHKVCLLIAHYGGFGALAESLEPALMIFPPEHIFVCHNSNHQHPFDKGKAGQTLKKIRALETRLGHTKHVNYSYSCEGNKSLAIYATALRKCTHMKYCMMIDNDVILPEDLHIPMDIFGDKNQNHVKALAFTIKASNPFNRAGKINWVSAMQSIEYIKAGWTKMLQSQLGSALYAHGAISLWEKDIMLSVFKAHNTFFDGEDLQMGVILHAFNQGYAIKTVGNVSVETEVPSHTICWNWRSEKAREQYPIPIFHDIMRLIFVAPLKCGGWGCGYNEKSLFRQRVASWDKGAHRAFTWYINLLLFNWSGSTLALKPYLIYEIWSIFNDWTWPWLMFLFFTSSTADDRAEFVEWMLMVTAVDLVLMSYMNEFKFSDRRDMRSRVWDCITFALYKYVLKVLRIFALVYNLFHYFPRAQTPLVIADRVALPQFIDDSCIFLDQEEADAEAIQEIWVNEDTGEIRVTNAENPEGEVLEGGIESGTALARTVDILTTTSDSVTNEREWKIHRPKHFMLRGDSWIIRRWKPCELGGSMGTIFSSSAIPSMRGLDSMRNKRARRNTGAGALPELDEEDLMNQSLNRTRNNSASFKANSSFKAGKGGLLAAALKEAVGNWDTIGEKKDKAGGSGLYHDLERMASTLGWAREILKTRAISKALSVAGQEDQHAEDEKLRITLQCAVQLGGCIQTCTVSAAALREMHKQGLRPSGLQDAEHVLTAVPVAVKLLELLMENDMSQIEDIRREARQQIRAIRHIASRLQPRLYDPEGDIVSVLTVLFAIGMGIGCAWGYELLDNHTGGDNTAHSIAQTLGLPNWTANWLWFVAIFLAAAMIFSCSLAIPLTVHCLNKGKGQKVGVPLRQVKTEKDS